MSQTVSLGSFSGTTRIALTTPTPSEAMTVTLIHLHNADTVAHTVYLEIVSPIASAAVQIGAVPMKAGGSEVWTSAYRLEPGYWLRGRLASAHTTTAPTYYVRSQT